MMVTSLYFNNTAIPLTAGTFTEKRTFVDNRMTSQAGTTMRVMVRSGIVGLEVKLTADDEEKAVLDGFADAESLAVKYYSEKAAALVEFTGFIDGYSASLKVEDTTNEHRWYEISFSVVNLHG
jgi:hypothetical protein